jgi:membrane-bound metal-dependent hydrolase YbcI (DUF457 family)
LTGLCVARSLPEAVRGRDTTLIVVAASLLPDADVVWSLLEPETAALNRHLLTHSLAGVALLSAGFGAFTWVLARRLPLIVHVALVGLAIGAHLCLDLINAYGVALLYPWSAFRFELPLAFILDPVLTGLLLAGLLIPALVRKPASTALAARSALALVGCYLAACFSLRVAAEQMVAARASSTNGSRWTYLVPELGSPLRWKGIYRDGETYRQMLVRPLSGSVVDLEPVRSTPNHRSVAAARATVAGQEIEVFFKAPVWIAEAETVIAYDLRFRFASLGNDWDPFGFCFRRVGDRFVLAQEDFDSYLVNWRRGVLKFVLLQSAEPLPKRCATAPVGEAKSPHTGDDRHVLTVKNLPHEQR